VFLRTNTRKNKDGSTVEYLLLAHNYRDPVTKRPKAEILYNFGRRDRLNEENLRRLARSIRRFLGPEEELAAREEDAGAGSLRFVESRPMGSAWLLRGLWEQLRVDKELVRLAAVRRFKDPAEVEGTVFAMAVNRALEPLSKHATPAWLFESVFAPGAPEWTYDERLYRAMDFLIDAEEEVQKGVFSATADLLNLDVDLLLYDTTSSYFEMEGDDEDLIERDARWTESLATPGGKEPTRPVPQVVNRPPLRMQGHSKDHRPDLAQVVIGLAVTREGIPVRCWVFPGNTSDVDTITTVKRSLSGWRLNRVVWAVDRGMVSDENLRTLQEGGAHYVAGEKMRAGRKEVEEALSRAGRFHTVRDNLEVKEVVVGKGECRKRYVLVRNPAQVAKDREDRERLLSRLEEKLAGLPSEGEEHSKEVCRLVAHPTMGRFLTKDKKGRLVIDRAKVKAEERLDGKYLIVTSDDTLSTEDVALGYKQRAEVERAWRDTKSELEIRPMYHRKTDRIRAHVLLCWLALLLIRVVEVKTGTTWPRVRQEMDRLHRGVFDGNDGQYVQRTAITQLQQRYLKAVKVPPPPLFEKIEAAVVRDQHVPEEEVLPQPGLDL